MIFSKQSYKNIQMEISSIAINNVEESHIILKTKEQGSFEAHLKELHNALKHYLSENKLTAEQVLVARFFVSDSANQCADIQELGQRNDEFPAFSSCALSIVQQPPLDANKISLWVYIINDKQQQSQKNKSNNEVVFQRGGYQHVWHTQLMGASNATTSHVQTDEIFSDFDQRLQQKQISVKDNCIRTWIYVKDVDYNYAGVVEARKAYFEKLGMTKDTHFIASTGIEGRHQNPNHNVLMDAYSVGGISQEQVKFLEAREYLNPTHEYGVTFERGTAVDYGDRRHIFISGTASIDNKGAVVHLKEVDKQIDRAIENIAALLKDADAEMNDVAQMIIYLRDVADRDVVQQYFDKHFGAIPKVIVLAPVCRPEWLIEIECIAVKPVRNEAYVNF